MSVRQKSMFEAEMTMTIKNIRREDLGSYICVAKNSLGDVESKIRLYGITFSSILSLTKITKCYNVYILCHKYVHLCFIHFAEYFYLSIFYQTSNICGSRPHIERATVFAFQSTNPLTNAKSKLTLNIEVVIVKSALSKIQKRIITRFKCHFI